MQLGLGIDLGNSAFLGRVSNLVPPPAGLGWTPDFTISKIAGVYSTNFDIDARKPSITGTQYYVNSNVGSPPGGWGVGSDSNNGTSIATPFLTLRKAVAVINLQSASLVHGCKSVCGTVYRSSTLSWQGLTLSKSAVFESVDGSRTLSVQAAATAPSYTKTGGQTNVYQMSLAAAPAMVLDFTNIVAGSFSYAPEYGPLTLVADVATCDSTAGSYFWDAGLILYVHPFDGRAADSNVQPTTTSSSGAAWANPSVGAILWMENIDFIGGATAFANTSNDASFRTYRKNCTYQASNTDGTTTTTAAAGIDHYWQNGAYNTGGDGLSQYGTTASSNDGPWKVEMNCRARRNGHDGSTANNCSTQHAACKTITLNPDYSLSQDRCVHDVSTAKRWMLGGAIGPSAAVGATSRTLVAGNAAQSVSIYVDGTTITAGSVYDLNTTSGCSILFKGSVPGGLTTDPANAGTIGTY